jgi:hypothetical protein
MNLYNLISFEIREDMMSTVRTRSFKVGRILLAALFIATLLLGFSRDVAYANGATKSRISTRVHDLAPWDPHFIYTSKFRIVETPRGTYLNCQFDFKYLANDPEANWPDKSRIATGFGCYEYFPGGQFTTNSWAVAGVGGRITMKCFFPADGG